MASNIYHVYAVLLVSALNLMVGGRVEAKLTPECEKLISEKNLFFCCEYPKPSEENSSEIKKNMQTCFDSLKMPKETDEEKTAFTECLLECSYNASGLLTEDLKLNLETYQKLTPFMKEDKWKNVETALVSCKQKATTDVKETSKCKSGALQFLNCVQEELLFICPDHAWTENKECAEGKEILQKCKPV